MSDFLFSVRKIFEQWYEKPDFPRPPKTLLLFHANKALWLNKRRAFEEFVEAVYETYDRHGNLESDKKAWRKAINNINADRRQYDPKSLLKLLDKAWQPTLTAEFALYGAEASISKHLKDFTEEERHRIWGAFSLPQQPNFINKIDADVVRLKNPEKLADKYPWALNSYAGVAKRTSLTTYFSHRIKDLENNNEVLLGTPTRREATAKKYNLSEDLCRQLDLARHIAEFMDKRKAWMMQTRHVIQKLAQHQAEEHGANILAIERCRLEDLIQPDPQEYFGWTYINGKNIDLSKQDVERSWDWYVAYKAATSVLHGIVSSRGGKHFMVGEVIVVHDPAGQVADGKIVVVPSTGPSYVPIMRRAAALITDHGGMMSHAAIVAREFNLPCIVGTVHATKILKNGDKVVLDLVKGEISR